MHVAILEPAMTDGLVILGAAGIVIPVFAQIEFGERIRDGSGPGYLPRLHHHLDGRLNHFPIRRADPRLQRNVILRERSLPMRSDNRKNEVITKPQQQTDEEFGSIKGRQRGEDDFKGKSDTPRGSEPETRGAAGRRG